MNVCRFLALCLLTGCFKCYRGIPPELPPSLPPQPADDTPSTAWDLPGLAVCSGAAPGRSSSGRVPWSVPLPPAWVDPR